MSRRLPSLPRTIPTSKRAQKPGTTRPQTTRATLVRPRRRMRTMKRRRSRPRRSLRQSLARLPGRETRRSNSRRGKISSRSRLRPSVRRSAARGLWRPASQTGSAQSPRPSRRHPRLPPRRQATRPASIRSLYPLRRSTTRARPKRSPHRKLARCKRQLRPRAPLPRSMMPNRALPFPLPRAMQHRRR